MCMPLILCLERRLQFEYIWEWQTQNKIIQGDSSLIESVRVWIWAFSDESFIVYASKITAHALRVPINQQFLNNTFYFLENRTNAIECCCCCCCSCQGENCLWTHPLVLDFDTINEVVLLVKFQAYQFTWKLFDWWKHFWLYL